jgi:hypothetical protein
MISSTAASLIAVGEVFGRRDRGSNAPALSPVPGQQRVNPGPGDPVGPGHLAHRTLLDSDSSDDKPRLRHPPTVPARYTYDLRHAIRMS